MGDTALRAEGGRVRRRYVRRKVVRTPETASEERTTATYHEFTDLPKTTTEYEYEGNGLGVVRFFKENSNYDELIRGMSRTELDDFNWWMGGHFMHGQQYEGFDKMNSREQRATRAYDRILDQAVLREGVTLRRLATAELILGAGNRNVSSLAQLQAMRGKVITSIGNMSTAAAAHGLGIGSEARKQVEYVIKIPAGTKGAGMWIGDKRIGGWGVKQREFMTNRDINFKVGETTYNRSTGKYEVELIYDGRNEHNYGRSRR